MSRRLCDGFCRATEIHSPEGSTLPAEAPEYINTGLKLGFLVFSTMTRIIGFAVLAALEGKSPRRGQEQLMAESARCAFAGARG